MSEQPPKYDSGSESPRRMEVLRCPSCGRVLLKIALMPGSMIEIKCHSCKAFVIREAA